MHLFSPKSTEQSNNNHPLQRKEYKMQIIDLFCGFGNPIMLYDFVKSIGEGQSRQRTLLFGNIDPPHHPCMSGEMGFGSYQIPSEDKGELIGSVDDQCTHKVG